MAKTTDIVITDRAARGLKCPFTGEELAVVGHVADGRVVYNAPEAFSLSEPQASVERLYARASMRGGVEGAVSRAESLTDPYTGRRLVLDRLPDGRYRFRGGFDPRRATLSLADFVRQASRGERSVGAAPEAKSVERVEEDVPTPADDSHDAHKLVEEMSDRAAHEVARAAGLDKGRVTVAVSKPGRRR